MIVDTHTHVVGDESVYPQTPRPLSGEWYREAPCSAEQLIQEMDAAGVGRAVLVQAVGAYSFDNRYACDSAAAHPDRFVSAVCVDPDGEDPGREIERWLGDPNVHGIRLFAISGGQSWLREAALPLWQRAEALGAHLIVTILPNQLEDLRIALARVPNVPVSLDHCAFPDPANPEALFALADAANLHLKVTTHVLDAAGKPDGNPAPFVAKLVEHFGAERVMWGSDFSQTHDRPYAELVELARRGFAGVSGEEREACLGGTALRLWPSLGVSS